MWSASRSALPSRSRLGVAEGGDGNRGRLASCPGTSVTDAARSLRNVLRCHWIFAVLLMAGLILRVLSQIAYRPALLYIDSIKYLYGASPGADPVGYQAPLKLLLFFGNLSTVAAVQHVLGLVMAVALYVLLL